MRWTAMQPSFLFKWLWSSKSLWTANRDTWKQRSKEIMTNMQTCAFCLLALIPAACLPAFPTKLYLQTCWTNESLKYSWLELCPEQSQPKTPLHHCHLLLAFKKAWTLLCFAAIVFSNVTGSSSGWKCLQNWFCNCMPSVQTAHRKAESPVYTWYMYR